MENEPRHCATFGQNKATALRKDEARTLCNYGAGTRTLTTRNVG